MPPSLRLVVLATGDLAIPVLEAALDAGHTVERLIARPRRSGEDTSLPEERQGSRLEHWARQHEIKIRRPSHPGGERSQSAIRELAPDLGLVVAFGRRFPLPLLELPDQGWLKVHYSLLPKNRGLNPIRAAIWYGEKKTGVSVIEVDEEPDSGPILVKEEIDIEPAETFGELLPRLEELAPTVAAGVLGKLAGGKKIKRRKQNEKSATKTPLFGKRHLKAPWWRDAETVYNRLRALMPEPGMTTLIRRKRIRLMWGEPMPSVKAPFGEPGAYLGIRSGRVAVLCGNDSVFGIESVLLENEPEPIRATELARDLDLGVGNVLV